MFITNPPRVSIPAQGMGEAPPSNMKGQPMIAILGVAALFIVSILIV